jgi:exosortase/archaeosortase family protein
LRKENATRYEGEVYRIVIIVAALSFLMLPFFTTFNEFLTKVVEKVQLVGILQSVAAPFIVRMIAGILGALKIPTICDGPFIYLTGGWLPLKIYLGWNCIGWQSLVVLVFTFLTGLQGPFTWRSKIMVIFLGLEGVFILNVVRILIPTMLAYYWGSIPALLFHDYMGTLFILLWMVLFWYIVFGYVLKKKRENGEIILRNRRWRNL